MKKEAFTLLEKQYIQMKDNGLSDDEILLILKALVGKELTATFLLMQVNRRGMM